MEEKILTLHPEGKKGVNISKIKYETIREAILMIIAERGVVSFKDLTALAEERLSGNFKGSIPWYVVSVKLDLEARGVIERVPGSNPQQIRLVRSE